MEVGDSLAGFKQYQTVFVIFRIYAAQSRTTRIEAATAIVYVLKKTKFRPSQRSIYTDEQFR